MAQVDPTTPQLEPPASTIYTAPVLRAPTPSARETSRDETVFAGYVAGGSSFESVCGAGAAVLAIIGLAGVLPASLCAVASIAVGAALVAFSGALAARWKEAQQRLKGRDQQVELASLGTEGFAGLAGIVLGILALVGLAPFVLLSISAIVMGGALLVGGVGEAELTDLEPGGPTHRQRMMREALRGAGSVMAIAGGGAVVLGILALIGVGPGVTLALVSMLALGGGLLLAGAAAAAAFGLPMLRRHGVA